ncbi:MAG: hypothetical protein U1E18_26295 [Brevundimonas sp.]|uniref:hypothetical protein n=1 Tax=Brevundimonas sp. TaxID=1871086 RepID=UPI002ABA0635|nr:hypothetical protein [Brevundimonas sp.]MDZ4113083.1 hypothetical protein [Brevundimonas sp.]
MALLHPAWLLLATLLTFAGQLTAMSLEPSGIVLAAFWSVLMSWFVLGWAYGIYRVAREVSERRKLERGPDRDWIFGLSAIAFLILPTALTDFSAVVNGLRDLVGGVGALSFFASFWLAAAALVTAEGHPVRHPTNRAVGAFLLIVYSFIGAWFLRPRILALLDAPRPPDEVRLD